MKTIKIQQTVKIHLRHKRKAKLKLKLKLELNLELKLRSRLKLNLSNSAIKRRRQTGKHSRDANWESKQGGKLGIKSIGKIWKHIGKPTWKQTSGAPERPQFGDTIRISHGSVRTRTGNPFGESSLKARVSSSTLTIAHSNNQATEPLHQPSKVEINEETIARPYFQQHYTTAMSKRKAFNQTQLPIHICNA